MSLPQRFPAAFARDLLRKPWSFAAALAVVLLIANLAVQPSMLSSANLAATLTLAAPLIVAALASTPSILTGGIDVAVGPLMGLINVLMIIGLSPVDVSNPVQAIVAFAVIGAGIGAVNGVLVTVVRLQPVVATIGMYLVLTGLNLRLLPVPKGPAPAWIDDIAGSIGPVPGALLLLAVPVATWIVLRLTPYHTALLAVGGDEAAAYSTGIPTAVVKVVAYTVGGFFAAIGGISLTALLSSADATVGPTYTVVAIAAVALGGTSLAGGRGGLAGSFLGGFDIFLIDNLLTALGLSSLWLPLLFGATLILSLIIGARVLGVTRERSAAS